MGNTEQTASVESDAAKPIARMVHAGKQVKLQYPIEFDGKLYDAAHVRMASAKEIRLWMVSVSNAEDGNSVVPVGVDVPQDVWDAMSMDDQDAIVEAVDAFTPARLKEAYKRASENGESTSQ